MFMKRVLITGASGFLGTNLLRMLHDLGYSLRVLVRPGASLQAVGDLPIERVDGNIASEADVMAAVAGCQYVVHAASITGQTGISFSEYERVNVTATQYIAAACLRHGVEKLVHVSTANTIAPGTLTDPGTELNGFSLFKANSGYINSKFLAQQYVLEQVATRGLPAVVVNPTFMVGPRDTKPSSGKLILFGLDRKWLPYPPGGKNIVHIADVCAGVEAALRHGRNGECYLLAGDNITYRDFFTLRNQIMGLRQTLVPLPGLLVKAAGAAGSLWQSVSGKPQAFTSPMAYMACVDNYYSSRKTETELGVRFASAENAFAEAIQWFRENGYC
jgi:dihydroflavonol-4-reductase